MTDRSMNYDLDGIFNSRNQGQLISSAPIQRTTQRVAGLVPMKRTLNGYVEAASYSGTAGVVDPNSWLNSTQTLPIIGEVSNKMLLLGAVGIAAAFYMMKKKSA